MSNPLKKAIRLHRSGQLGKARVAYERILRSDANQPDALHFLGMLFHQQGRSDVAVRLIRQAIDVSPDYPAAHQNLGNIYQAGGKPAEALECYRIANALNPTDADVLSNMCIVLKYLDRVDESIETGLRATRLEPGNKLAWLSLANALKRVRKYGEAIECYEKALEVDEKFFAAHNGLCQCTYRAERARVGEGALLPEATKAYRRWLAVDPGNPVAEHLLAACSGDSGIQRASDGFVTGLFDEFAQSFDQNLADLDYRVPGLVARQVREVLDSPAAQYDVLDAGCGTGLLAADLKPWARTLQGVDLSAGMLEKARGRGLYDELAEAELSEYLSDNPGSFDLVICADTLCYFGELEEVLTHTAAAMRRNGVFICSFEEKKEGEQPWKLNPHGRYSHRESYVQSSFSSAGLRVDEVRHEVLRRECGQPVAGLIYVVRTNES